MHNSTKVTTDEAPAQDRTTQREKRRGEWAARRAQRASKHRLSRMPLRVSLVFVVMSVSAIGMAVAAAIVTSTLQQFMLSRIDTTLDAVVHSPYVEQGRIPSSNIATADPQLPSQYYVQVNRANGSVVNYGYGFNSVPNLDSVTAGSEPVTVEAATGSSSNSQWRAIATTTPDGDLVIVAMSMENLENTINRMVVLEVGIGLFVLGVSFVVSWFLVHRALRPLSHVERTAGKIANGDLGKRLPPWPVNTEVGHLASSLNKMLAQIEQSFVAVERSEAQAQANAAAALKAEAKAKSNAAAALKAEAQAREAEATMRRFIGDASHELRTPLTSVRGYAELYKKGQTDDAAWVLEKIDAESSRMSLLVEDLLALARMDDSRPMEKIPVDLLEVIITTVQNMKVNFPDRSITMSSNCSAPPVVIGDNARLYQVVSNLTTNALKHAGPDASVHLSLGEGVLHTGDADVPAVTVQVTDNGVGIAPEDCAHIFERFYRADASRNRSQGGGSGLGLAIVKGLVEQHNGTIEVSSVVGEGTTFTVTLPRESIHEPTDGTEAEPGAQE